MYTALLLCTVLPVIIYMFDKVSTSEWGVRAGLSKSPEARLKELYMKYNPSKISQIPSLLRKHKGREAELYERIEAKYKLQEKLRKEEAEYAD
jgi:hypothetical protein